MLNRYFETPYKFIPPIRSKVWCRLAQRFIPGHLRKKMHIERWHFRGESNLEKSLDRRAGILLASNHCRYADAFVLGMLGVHLREYFYYIVSYHLFKQSRVHAWLMQRLGGYSIWREGADRTALRTTAEILGRGERPIVLFPEGTWFRQNDRVAPLQEGISLILRQAVRHSDRPIVVHPTALKYWVLEDPRKVLEERLAMLERQLGWVVQDHLEIIPRIEKLTCAMLAVREIEFYGSVPAGTLDERIPRLAEAIVHKLELTYLERNYEGWTLERVRRLRQHLARQLVQFAGNEQRVRPIREALEQLFLCENLIGHSLEYLANRPSFERLVETVQRLEEILFDSKELPVVPLGASVSVGPGIDVRQLLGTDEVRWKETGANLLPDLSCAMQALLDEMLDEGPPSSWGCPQRIEPQTLELSPVGRNKRSAVPATE